MNITKINNTTSFKQIFIPGYKHYSEDQKEIADDIRSKIDNDEEYHKLSELNNGIFRPDIFVTRAGSDDSLTVFNCKRDFSYRSLQPVYYNKIYVGTYNKSNPFNTDDVDNARNQSRCKQIITGLLVAAITTLGIQKILKHKI